MDDQKNTKKGKRVIAVSRGSYRGISIFETMKNGFVALLGVMIVSSNNIKALTDAIDEYWNSRKN